MINTCTWSSLKPWVGGALFAFMLACGGESPAPPPAPRPPAFQPQNVVIDLGTAGGKITVISTQAGGWTLNGEPVQSGAEVKGTNGATYKLTLANGRWSAEFVAPEPAMLALGTSGESVSIESLEDGSFAIGGEPVETGALRTAANGNQYRLSLGDDGTWRASYVSPEPTVVSLGQSSATAVLVRQEDGSYTLRGSPLASGQVWEAPNGNSYRFTRDGDMWTAEFVPGPPLLVTLGTSGDTAELIQQENGRYAFRGEDVFSGQVYEAGNGNSYRFVQRSLGVWVAEYVAPPPVEVPLGDTGNTVLLERLESGQFSLDGEPIESGDVAAVPGGNRYRFILRSDGSWRTEFVSAPTAEIMLGTSDETVTVDVLEDGRFVLDGQPLVNNEVRTVNGNQYRFNQRLDGSWRATYVPSRVNVPLGNLGGSIELVRLEDGTFTRNGNPVVNGDVVTGNGQRYELTLADGQWTAEHVPEAVTVSVPNSDVLIILLRQEDGQYTHEGTPVLSGDDVEVDGSTYALRLSNGRWSAEFVEGRITVSVGSRGDTLTIVRMPDGTFEHEGRRVRNGSVVRHPDTGVRYTLRLQDGVWSARIYFPPTTGGGTDPGDGGTSPGGTPEVVEDLEDALPDGFLRDSSNNDALRSSAMLFTANQGDKDDVDYSDYRGRGAVESETFVEAARNVLQDIINKIKPLVEGDGTQQSVARLVIEARWQDARDALSGIFDDIQVNGTDTPAGEVLLDDLPSNADHIDEEDRLDDLEDLVEALSSVAAFRRELGTTGEFKDFNSQQGNAEKIFKARKRSLALATTDNTRFGVIAEPTGGSDTTAQTFVTSNTALVSRAFAWSPLDETLTSSLPSRGTARYTGRTLAVEPADGELFSGTIELLASFGIERITGEITNLAKTDDGDRWEYDGRDVGKIVLPVIEQAVFDGNGKFNLVSGGSATIELEGTQFDRTATSEFTGQFVGDDGEEVFGTWAIIDNNNVRVVEGAYGAEYRSTTRVTLPNSDNDGRSIEFSDANTSVTLNGTQDTLVIAIGVLADATKTFGLNSLYRRSSDTNTENVGGTDHTLAVRFRRTSFTRFGAWSHISEDGFQSSGTFGYSPLGATDFDANNFPRNVDARYVGRTVAVDGAGKLYDGDFTLSVEWSDSGGSVESVVRNLRAVSGGARFEIQGIGVELFAFQASVAASGELSFTSATNALVEYVTNTRTTLTSGVTHSGHFVGDPPGVDGPYAVIGSWGVTHQGASIEGEFGADLDPSP